jgi:hypothetical protein
MRNGVDIQRWLDDYELKLAEKSIVESPEPYDLLRVWAGYEDGLKPEWYPFEYIDED